jgi:hypothetical protein
MRLRPLILASVAAAAAFSLLAAGCGGSASPRVAIVGSATTAANTTAATAPTDNGLLAFSSCMRSNGVPSFPDPTSSGGIPKQAVVTAFQAVGNSRVEAASSACRHLLGAGGSLSGKATQPVTVDDRQSYLKAAACMRSRGFAAFPDPTFENNSVQLNIPSSIDQDASQFRTAATVCSKLIPAGLPYSRSSGS